MEDFSRERPSGCGQQIHCEFLGIITVIMTSIIPAIWQMDAEEISCIDPPIDTIIAFLYVAEYKFEI